MIRKVVTLTNLMAEHERYLVQVDLDSMQVMVLVEYHGQVLTLVVGKFEHFTAIIKNAVNFIFCHKRFQYTSILFR